MKFEGDFSSGLNKEVFEDFCLWANKTKASDIFVNSEYPIMMKRHKKMVKVTNQSFETECVARLLRQMYRSSAPEELYEGNPISFNYNFLDPTDDTVLRFRCEATGCNDSMTDKGISIVLRVIPPLPPTVEELRVEKQIVKMMESDSGIIIISGTTNSGKSTLASSLIRWLATSYEKHIITYEAPIEYTLNGFENQSSLVVQSQVYKHLNNFSDCIRNALRRSPDCIFVGEMRDAETIKEGVIAADTGHVVLSTLHASSPEQSVSRMVNEFPKSEQANKAVSIVQALRGIITQQLVNKKGGGLVDVKGVLDVDNDMRDRVLSGLSSGENIIRLLDKEVKVNGFSMVDNAKSKYSSGLITLSTLLGLIRELGNKNDLEGLDVLAKSCFSRKLMTEDELDDDLKVIKGLYER